MERSDKVESRFDGFDRNKTYFIITVDTEGDNLWTWKNGERITTENSLFIPRFQELCEEYGFIPTYLTNYEMVNEDRWITYAKRKLLDNKCEIGMHLHAWNTPPDYSLQRNSGGNSYITEYPEEIIDAKVKTMTELLAQTFEKPVTSNRSGRWATNEVYFRSLQRHGISVDCSVTPGIDLSGIPGFSSNCGNDYRQERIGIYEIYPGLIEVPMTTKRIRVNTGAGLRCFAKTLLKGEDAWLRPIPKCAAKMKALSRYSLSNAGYIEFMVHSSELMPAGSPYFRNDEDIEALYAVLRDYFDYLAKAEVQGISLTEYARKYGKEE